MANFFLDNIDLQLQLEHPLMERLMELRERGYAEREQYDFAPQDFDDAMDSLRRVMEPPSCSSTRWICPVWSGKS